MIQITLQKYQVERISKLISSLPHSKVEPALDRGCAKAAAFLEGEAKRLCPVDTGRLRNSITHTVDKSKTAYIITIGTNVEYAAYVEFGTGPVGEASTKGKNLPINIAYRRTGWSYPYKDSFRYTRGQPARPYMYPALINNRGNVAAIIEDSLKEVTK